MKGLYVSAGGAIQAIMALFPYTYIFNKGIPFNYKDGIPVHYRFCSKILAIRKSFFFLAFHLLIGTNTDLIDGKSVKNHVYMFILRPPAAIFARALMKLPLTSVYDC